MILLDSSAVVDLFLGTARGKKVKETIGQEPISVTSFSIHEVLIGVKEKEREIISDFFKSILIIPFDAAASYRSLELEISLRRKGKIMAKVDLFIASISLLHNLPLLTTDSDFREVEGLQVLHVE